MRLPFKRILLLCLPVFLFPVVVAAGSWETIAAGNAIDFTKVFFANADTGFITGTSGTLLITENAGKTWSTRNPGVSEHLRGGCFVDAKTAYVSGSHGLILKSSDFGMTWKRLPTPDTADLGDIVFASAANGFVTSEKSAILRTVDSGNTWSKVDFTAKNAGATQAIIFPTAQIGFLVCTLGALRTQDGGETWRVPPGFNLGSAYYSDGFFLNADTGFFASYYYGTIVKTFDQANTLKPTHAPGSFTALTFLTPEIGYAISRDRPARCFRTDDQGSNWNPDSTFPVVNATGVVRPIADIGCAGGKVILAVGADGFIARKAEANPTAIAPSRKSALRMETAKKVYRADGRRQSGYQAGPRTMRSVFSSRRKRDR